MPDARLPAHLARRVLANELTIEQALEIEHADSGAALRPRSSTRRAGTFREQPSPPPWNEPIETRPRQREQRGGDGLNKTERRYRDEVLEPRKRSGEIADYVTPCPMKLRLGPDWTCSLEPDALVIPRNLEDDLELVDVKATRRTRRADGSTGHRPLSQDDARAKIHAAASLFPFFRFTVAHPIPKKDGGGWQEKSVS